jgi:trehalose/maltose hydrolase-like predicted phosphorylase
MKAHNLREMRRKTSMNLWQITEERFDPKKMHAQESVYTIGNGYFATRGAFEERYFGASAATLL